MTDQTVFDPVAEDGDVLAAIAALDMAMQSCADRHGVELTTVIIAWVVSNNDGTHTAGTMIAGDTSAEVIEFATATIEDDSFDLPVPGAKRVMQ
jgi:aryl-alcohol dehydrogenase-like predicted oxidoreductase